jgi:hypothetical protein
MALTASQIVSAIKDYTKKEVKRLFELGGVKVEKEHGEAREKICKACDYTEGPDMMKRCKACNCFISIMPHFESHVLKGGEKVECGHPEEDKWKEINELFNK